MNIKSNTSEAVSGMGMVGPIGELKSPMVNGVKLEDQSVGRAGAVELTC